MSKCRYRYWTDCEGRLGGSDPRCKLAIGAIRCKQDGKQNCSTALNAIGNGVPVPALAQVAGIVTRSSVKVK